MKRSIAVLSIAAALALTGCSASVTEEGEAPVASSAGRGPTVGPTESQAGADVAGPNPNLNERGNLPTAVGEEHQAFNQATGVIAGTFTVSSLAPGECAQDTGFEVPEPQNGGRLIFVTMKVDAAAADGTDNPLYANSGGGVITFIQGDGTTWNGDDVRAAGCLPPDETIGALVNPGESVKGIMVLDVPATAVTLVFKPTLGQGYEYALP